MKRPRPSWLGTRSGFGAGEDRRRAGQPPVRAPRGLELWQGQAWRRPRCARLGFRSSPDRGRPTSSCTPKPCRTFDRNFSVTALAVGPRRRASAPLVLRGGAGFGRTFGPVGGVKLESSCRVVDRAAGGQRAVCPAMRARNIRSPYGWCCASRSSQSARGESFQSPR